ncbi:hypothetical protein ACFL0O_10895, partial [Thermodesulfobacteriota bacterium]
MAYNFAGIPDASNSMKITVMIIKKPLVSTLFNPVNPAATTLMAAPGLNISVKSKPDVSIPIFSSQSVVVIAGMRAAADILVPFLLAGFIAIVSAPLMFWMKRKG